MREIEVYMLVLLLAIAVGEDLYCGRIRNSLIIVGSLAGLIFAALGGNSVDVCWRLMGFLFPLVFLYVLFIVGGLGAGDIKLFAVVGSFIGIKGLLYCVVASFFVAAIYGVIQLGVENRLWGCWQRIMAYLQRCVQQRALLAWPEEDRTTITFSVAILIGVWMYLEGWI